MPDLSRSEILAYVAANLRRLRGSKLTQQQLEAATGLGVQYIRKIERGRVNITIDTLRRLANALGVPPSHLLRKAKLSPPKPGRPRKRSARAR
jgi:transcriptional regulator with XRE-family HTH domain